MRHFERTYRRLPPWEIGRPQKEVVRLAEAGEISGSVLDMGCGTGENALYLASRGHEVLAIDTSTTAIEVARSKGRQRNSTASFMVWDALELESLNQTFDTVIDSGLFHAFVLSEDGQSRYAASLAAILPAGGKLLMLEPSEYVRGMYPRVDQAQIRAAFDGGWRIDYIRPTIFEVTGGSVPAWLASINRLEGDYPR